MWQLHMTNEKREWITAGRFEAIGAAVRRIAELEGSPRNGLFLRTYVDSLSTDDEALCDLEYKGETAHYVIRRERLAH
jgi:hypothetical protein